MSGITGRLENWIFAHFGNYFIIIGSVYGDAKGRFHDGKVIFTSSVMSVDKDQTIVRTKNSVYELGRPHTGEIYVVMKSELGERTTLSAFAIRVDAEKMSDILDLGAGDGVMHWVQDVPFTGARLS
jgi:hypothetical protein